MVEHGWRTWVAENLVRGCSDEVLRKKLVESGHTVEESDATIAALKDKAWLEVAKKLETRANKRDWLLRTLWDVQQKVSPGLTVERRTGLSWDEFHTRYYAQNKPVVMMDVARDWPAVSKWTPEYFRKKFGDAEVEVQTGRDDDPNYESRSGQHKSRMTFNAYADLVAKGESNDHYITANNGSANAKVFAALAGDVGPLPVFLDGGSASRAGYLWFGPAGTVTPNHHDLTNNLLVQVMGRKRVFLASSLTTPDMLNHLHVYSKIDPTDPKTSEGLTRKPLWVEVLLMPGDALFIPIGWWHLVKSVDTSMSLTFTNFAMGNDHSAAYRAATVT